MSKKRRDHGSAFKAKVAIAAIKEELTQAQITSQFGIHTTQVRHWKSQAIEAIRDSFSKGRERRQEDQEALITGLYEQIGRLQTELNWLKKNVELTIEEKRRIAAEDDAEITLVRRCELLGLSRSSYYFQKKPLDAQTERLLQLLDQHYTQFPHEGKIKRARWLSAQVGYTVGRKHVASLMKKMGVATVLPKAKYQRTQQSARGLYVLAKRH